MAGEITPVQTDCNAPAILVYFWLVNLLLAAQSPTQKQTRSVRSVKLLIWHTPKTLQTLPKYEWEVTTWDHSYSIHFLQHWATPSLVPKHPPFGRKKVFSPQIMSGAILQCGLLIIVWVRQKGEWIAVQGQKQEIEHRNLLSRSLCFKTESIFAFQVGLCPTFC